MIFSHAPNIRSKARRSGVTLRAGLRADILTCLLTCGLWISLTPAASAGEGSELSGDIAVRGQKVYTMAGEVLENGVVWIRDGKIAAVGPADEVELPADLEVLEAAVVTPGLIDAHTTVGISGYLNQDHDQDQLEESSPVQPELRAIDAYNARERLVEWVRDFGVTTIHTGHGPGAVISGQTLIAKTRGDHVAEAVIVETAMVAATLGEGAQGGNNGPKGWPGTRAKAAALLRAQLVEAQAYVQKLEQAEPEQAPSRDLRLETLAAVLRGELPLMVTVERHQDIMTALRIRDEFDIPMVLDSASEAYTLTDEIKASGLPVLVHPAMKRPHGETENLTLENAARLADAGIPIALQSGFEAYVPKTRVLTFEAAIAAANGLGFERTLAAVTIDAAEILGIADRVGSIEVGKDGDLALYDGDPFEYTSHCLGVVIDGIRFGGPAR